MVEREKGFANNVEREKGSVNNVERESSINTLINRIADCSYDLDSDITHFLDTISPILNSEYKTDVDLNSEQETIKTRSKVSNKLVEILNKLNEIKQRILDAGENIDIY